MGCTTRAEADKGAAQSVSWLWGPESARFGPRKRPKGPRSPLLLAPDCPAGIASIAAQALLAKNFITLLLGSGAPRNCGFFGAFTVYKHYKANIQLKYSIITPIIIYFVHNYNNNKYFILYENINAFPLLTGLFHPTVLPSHLRGLRSAHVPPPRRAEAIGVGKQANLGTQILRQCRNADSPITISATLLVPIAPRAHSLLILCSMCCLPGSSELPAAFVLRGNHGSKSVILFAYI